MALKLLTLEEMIYVTQFMVDAEQPTRAALESVAGLAPLMPHLDQAYNGLLVALDEGQVQSLAELTNALDEVDLQHDNLARTAYFMLEANIHLSRAHHNDDTAFALERLQALLFPKGLDVVKASYREEAGQAQKVSSRLTEENKTVLSSIPMYGGTLLDIVDGWLAAGVRLGELEAQRNAVNKPGRKRAVARARSQWIHAIRTMRNVVELIDCQDPLVQEALGRIYAAEMGANPRAYQVRAEDGATPNEDASGRASTSLEFEG